MAFFDSYFCWIFFHPFIFLFYFNFSHKPHIVELYAKNLANLSVSVSPILNSTYPHKYLRSISIPSSYHLLLIIYHLCIILPWTSWMCSHILILFAVHSFLPFPCWYCLKLLFWVLINTLIYFYLFLYFLDSKNYSNYLNFFIFHISFSNLLDLFLTWVV